MCVRECTMHLLSVDVIDFIFSICFIWILNCSCQIPSIFKFRLPLPSSNSLSLI